MRDLHPVCEYLQPIAVRVSEIERATAAAVETAVRFDAVSQRAPVDFNTMGVQVSQCSHKLIAVFNFEGNLLDEPFPLSLRFGDIDPFGGRAHDEVMVRVVKPQKSNLLCLI